ncbi:hypothetical protein EON79_20405 [bacterium]|nr:MAG: hypothetical protein EON79_20405 [bacterium]
MLAHGFSGRIPGMLEGRLASSEKWFAYRVDAEIGRGGKDTLTLSLEKTQDQPSVRPPSTAPKGEPELEGAREVALRMTRGFPRRIEPETVARAFKMLDELRAARLEKVRARVDAEGWRRLQEKMANPKSWDGKSPIRFGDLDPGIQERLIQSLNGGKISPDEMVGPIRFNFYIGLGEGKGAPVNGIFGAYR